MRNPDGPCPGTFGGDAPACTSPDSATDSSAFSPSARPRAGLQRLAALAASAGLLAVCVAGAGAAGDADPSFAPGGGLSVGYNPIVAVADVNRDGKPDLAVANRASNAVTILLGAGASGFRTAAGSPTPVGGSPASLAVADLDRDGTADLAVANGGSSEITLLLGNGTGRFRAAATSPLALAGLAGPLNAPDLDGDGDVDLVASVYEQAARRWRIAILLGDRSGRFAAAPGSPLRLPRLTDGSPLLAVADFNGDRRLDLALGFDESAGISILLGDGAGRFGAGRTVLAGTIPRSVVAADVNGDSKADLAVTSQHRVTVLLGGGFRAAPGSPFVFGKHEFPRAMVATDLNRDGRPDLAVNVSPRLAVLLGNGAGRFRPAAGSPFTASGDVVAAADFNGDAKLDLLLPDGRSGTLTILYQTPSTPAAVRARTLPARPPAVLSTRGPIVQLAADGNRVAVITAGIGGACDRVVVWTAPGRKAKSFKPGYLGCEGDGLGDLAVGGGQVAWIERGGGNFLELQVRVTDLSGRAARLVEAAHNGARAAGNASGQWVGHLLGGGPLLAYNSWTVVCDTPPDHGCAPYQPWEFHLTDHRLVRISAGRRLRVKSGPASYPLSAVGGGRMAVESAGAVTVLAANGSAVASVPAVDGNPPRAIALSRTRLAVARTFTLDLYDPATGTAAKSISLGPAAALELAGVNSKLALLCGPRRLVLIRLGDGKLISLPLRSGAQTRVEGARLTDAGVFYAYDTPRASAKGRIVFEPTGKLLARF